MKVQNSEQIDASILHDLRQIKKNLKMLSKNQLINLVFQQMNMSMEMQNANKVLLEKLKQYEESKKNENT
jgi:hypothetical protein